MLAAVMISIVLLLSKRWLDSTKSILENHCREPLSHGECYDQLTRARNNGDKLSEKKIKIRKVKVDFSGELLLDILNMKLIS